MQYKTLLVSAVGSSIFGLWCAFKAGQKEKQFIVVDGRIRLLPVSTFKRVFFVASYLVALICLVYAFYIALDGMFDR